MRKKLSKYLIGIAAVIAVVAIGSFPAFALGASPVALVAAATTAATPFATQVKILAIAGSVYTILQVVKQVFPVAGLGAVVINVILSALGVAVFMKPEDLFSLQSLTALVVAGLTAAGAHGTVKSFIGSSGVPNPGGNTVSGVSALLCFSMVAMLTFTGCSPVEVQAYRIIVGAKAFTTSIGNAHPECGSRDANQHWVSAHNSSGACSALDKTIAAKDVLIDIAELYCSGPDFENGGSCNPPTDKGVQAQLVSKIKFAIQNYEQTEIDLKALLH
jgi:hypothetical protein